jgi:hypothetical protein
VSSLLRAAEEHQSVLFEIARENVILVSLNVRRKAEIQMEFGNPCELQARLTEVTEELECNSETHMDADTFAYRGYYLTRVGAAQL